MGDVTDLIVAQGGGLLFGEAYGLFKQGLGKCWETMWDERLKKLVGQLCLDDEDPNIALEKFLKDLKDDPEMRDAVVDGALHVMSAIHDACIPYIGATLHLMKTGKRTVDDRRIIRMFADCNEAEIETINHLVSSMVREYNTSEFHLPSQFTLSVREEKIPSGTTDIPPHTEIHVHCSSGCKPWKTDGHHYQSVFEILKKNYLATNTEMSTEAGDHSGPGDIMFLGWVFNRLIEIVSKVNRDHTP